VSTFVQAAMHARLARAGVEATLEAPDGGVVHIGAAPDRVRARFRDEAALGALRRGDVTALAEAYVAGAVDVEGDWMALLPVTRLGRRDPGVLARLAFRLALRLPGRTRRNARAIAFHYDRPPEFFLPWLGRWRSYSHGFYAGADDDLDVAQERKLAWAVEALGLAPGMHVLDMGAGWGSFVEYAGARGIHVHAITISPAQEAYVAELIGRHRLPCRIERVDFLDFRPARAFDAAVFMGTLEHVPDHGRVAAFLRRHLVPGGRAYADFCAQTGRAPFGAFLRRHVWPGPVAAVSVPALERAFRRAGLTAVTVGDDTASYACTVRDWADRLERAASGLAARFGESAVRTFVLYLRASQLYFHDRAMQAHHLVVERQPTTTPRIANAAAPTANRSPSRP
jgi:cyclopropane-fatty-acyl-phospholipid synthase